MCSAARADDPGAYYAADVRRVLELFVLAAEQGLELEADTLLAAAGAAPGVRSLSGRAAGAAAQRLLLSGAPEALGVLCAAGAYASFGLPQRAPCLHGLAEAPAVPMARWWLYLRRCGTSAVRDASLCAALELDAALPELMAALDVLAARKTPPADPAGAEACAEPPAGGRWTRRRRAHAGSGGPALEQPARHCTRRCASPVSLTFPPSSPSPVRS